MQFQSPPGTPWVRMLLKRGRLQSGEQLPALRAEWSPIAVSRLQVKLRSYREVCGFSATRIPLSYPMVFATELQMQLLSSPEFPLPVLGLVHVAQRMRWGCDLARRQEIFGAETETCRLSVVLDGQRQAKRGVLFTLRTTLETSSELLWEAETDILSMSAAGHGQDEPKKSPEILPAELTQQWILEADLGRRYAKVAGDFNPIHLYGWSAKLFGFRRAIIHGMWTLAHVLAQCQEAEQVEAHFVRPIFIPSRPSFELASVDQGAQAVVWQQSSGPETKLAMWALIAECCAG